MGLDQYLTARKPFPDSNSTNPDTLKEVTFDLGYWRKHPDLHGFIVREFAGGIDECQEIPLTTENIKFIIQAIIHRQLPNTEGFWFGKSDYREDEKSVKTFENALRWLSANPTGTIIYRASW